MKKPHNLKSPCDGKGARGPGQGNSEWLCWYLWRDVRVSTYLEGRAPRSAGPGPGSPCGGSRVLSLEGASSAQSPVVAALRISEIGTWGTFAVGSGRQATWIQNLAVLLNSFVVHVLMTRFPPP